jgi:hypothetical protein
MCKHVIVCTPDSAAGMGAGAADNCCFIAHLCLTFARPTTLLLHPCMQPSVEAAVAAHPERFVVADVKWTGGTEQMLDAVQQHFQQLDQQEQQQANAVGAAPTQCS